MTEFYSKYYKNFKMLNRLLDEDYNKLCDMYHDLELSHNRKKKALRWLHDFFHGMKPQELYESDLFYINKCIDDALFSDGRAKSRPIVQRKKKGGIE